MQFLIIFLSLFTLGAFAQESEKSLDELLRSEQYEEAAVFLREKIKQDPVEIKDILLLGKIYEGLDLNKKAIKTYLFGIRKIHSRSWKDIKNYKTLKEVLPDLKKPKKEALLLAYKVGVHYYDLYLGSESTTGFSRRILDTSLKYLLICEHFKFNLPKTKYFLGLIYKEYEDYRLASASFLDAWELFEKQKKVEPEEEQKIRLMIGESFVNFGHITAGNSYLRSVYYYKSGSRYLRNYASEYLDEFLGSNVGGSVSFYVGNDSNALLGNSVGDETVKGSQYLSKSGSVFLGHSPSYSSSYNFSLSFSEETYTETTLKDNDSRSLTFTSAWDYKKVERTILTFSYYLTKNYARPSSTEEFDPESDTHQFILTWNRVFRKSLFSISLPFSRTDYNSGSEVDTVGLNFLYEAITFSNYWNPSIGLDFSSVEEDQGFERSKNAILYFSNSMNLTENLGVSLDFSLENNGNTSDSLAYTERILGINGYYSFENLDGLSFDFSLSSESNTPKSGTSDTRLKTGVGLSYTL